MSLLISCSLQKFTFVSLKYLPCIGKNVEISSYIATHATKLVQLLQPTNSSHNVGKTERHHSCGPKHFTNDHNICIQKSLCLFEYNEQSYNEITKIGN